MTSTPSTQRAEAYQPSNGIEGADFMAAFCDRCTRDRAFREGTGDSCPIAADTMVFAVDSPDYPLEWVEDDQGPRCTAFEAEDDPSATGDLGALTTSPGAGS